MRVLLITYEFPPIESAQSLRWLYLSRHLIEYGVDLTVLTPQVVKTSVSDVPAAQRSLDRILARLLGLAVGYPTKVTEATQAQMGRQALCMKIGQKKRIGCCAGHWIKSSFLTCVVNGIRLQNVPCLV